MLSVSIIEVWHKRFSGSSANTQSTGLSSFTRAASKSHQLAAGRLQVEVIQASRRGIQKFTIWQRLQSSLRTILRCLKAPGWNYQGSAYCQMIREVNKGKWYELAQRYKLVPINTLRIWSPFSCKQFSISSFICIRYHRSEYGTVFFWNELGTNFAS